SAKQRCRSEFIPTYPCFGRIEIRPTALARLFQSCVWTDDRTDEAACNFGAQDRPVISLFERRPTFAVSVIEKRIVARITGDLELHLLRHRDVRFGNLLDCVAGLLFQKDSESLSVPS